MGVRLDDAGDMTMAETPDFEPGAEFGSIPREATEFVDSDYADEPVDSDFFCCCF